MTAADLEEGLDALAATHVKTYIVEVNSRQATFPSRCFDHFLDGFDMELGMNQPALQNDPKPWAYRRRANIQVLLRQGIDSSAYLMEGARKRGITPWVGIRMNDIHNGHNPDSNIHGKLWKQHPEWRISELSCENGFDYSRPEVRKLFLDFIEEVLERYDADGLFLDWLRWPTFVLPGTGPERAPLLTDFVAKARALADEAARRRGHGIELVCRVPTTPAKCLARGLDALAWAKQGLVDRLVIGNFGCSHAFAIPVEEWKQAVGRPEFPIIVSIDNMSWDYPSPTHTTIPLTPEIGRAEALEAYCRGAEGILVFNFQGFHRREQFRPVAEKLLNELDDPKLLATLPRHHIVNWDDNDMRVYELDRFTLEPGFGERWYAERRANGTYPVPLPVDLKPGESTTFRLNLGDVPEGAHASVSIRATAPVRGALNGVPLDLQGNTAPAAGLHPGVNEVTVTAADAPVQIQGCAIDVNC